MSMMDFAREFEEVPAEEPPAIAVTDTSLAPFSTDANRWQLTITEDNCLSDGDLSSQGVNQSMNDTAQKLNSRYNLDTSAGYKMFPSVSLAGDEIYTFDTPTRTVHTFSHPSHGFVLRGVPVIDFKFKGPKEEGNMVPGNSVAWSWADRDGLPVKTATVEASYPGLGATALFNEASSSCSPIAFQNDPAYPVVTAAIGKSLAERDLPTADQEWRAYTASKMFDAYPSATVSDGTNSIIKSAADRALAATEALTAAGASTAANPNTA